MNIYVVRAGYPKESSNVVNNRCFITFMTIDECGFPVKVETYILETEKDKPLEEVAIQAKLFAKA